MKKPIKNTTYKIKTNKKSLINSIQKEVVKNEKLTDCVARISAEKTVGNTGEEVTNLEVIARKIVDGSKEGNIKLLQLFVAIMNSQAMKVEQYNFDLPQFIYNINVDVKND